MDLSVFPGPSRLLVRALLSGPSGARRAVSVVRSLRRVSPESLEGFIESLCREEVSGGDTLTVKPLVCLFPSLFKQNLLSFIYLVHSALPASSVHRLLQCLSQDSHPNPWVCALGRQLERCIGAHDKEPLYSPACSQRLKELSHRLVPPGETGGWAQCFSRKAAESDLQSTTNISDLGGTQRKRKECFISSDSDGEERSRQSKRLKTDTWEKEHVPAEDQRTKNKTQMKSESDDSAETQTPAAGCPSDVLPEHIMASALQIKELLESQAEWDQSSTDLFRVLNDCDPLQVEVLCRTLSLQDLPEQTLPKLCSCVLALSPDLSFSTAATLIKSLLLEKIVSLSEPASRSLVTASTSLCSHYPRPVSHTLIGPLLEEKNIGPSQAELLTRLVEGCLDSHYRLLVFEMTFRISWSEAVLSVIHSLLDSKLVLNEEHFSQFTEQLVKQGPLFTKSVKFAKMLLTVLTKYSCHVTAEHKHSLSACLISNETFLKKSLQAALKRITLS